MSEENLTDEVQNKVTLSNEDCANIRKYCGHFGVPCSEGLESAIEKFCDENSFENQQEVKLELCKWMLESQHESFKDSLWDAPKEAAQEVVFDLQFDKDVKETLATDESESES